MQAHQRHRGGVGERSAGSVVERQRDVLAAVTEPVEAEDPGVQLSLAGEPQRETDLATDDGGGDA